MDVCLRTDVWPSIRARPSKYNAETFFFNEDVHNTINELPIYLSRIMITQERRKVTAKRIMVVGLNSFLTFN